MAHSIPYMAYVFGIASFVFVEMCGVYALHGFDHNAGAHLKHLYGFYAYGALTCCVIMYGECFMAGTFIRNAEKVWKSMGSMPVPEGPIEFDHKPLAASIFVVLLYILWGVVHPLRRHVLKMEVTTQSSVSPQASLERSPH